MSFPEPFDDPGPLVPQPPSRARRVGTVAIIVALIVSMVFLAFVSGRGLVTQTSTGPDRPQASPVADASSNPSNASNAPSARLAVVDAAGRLTTTDLTGTSVPLGVPGITYSFPVWSPSGDRVAVIGQDGDTGGVYITAVPKASGSDGPLPVYTSKEHPPFYVSWSPDGRQVAFLTTEGDSLALRVAAADGSAPASIVREGSPMYWTWTEPAQMLVHSGGEAPDAFIGEVDLAGDSVTPAIVGSGGFRAPAVSADGAFRAYVEPNERSSDQVVIEPLAGGARHVTDVYGTAALEFSPTGSDLAFIAPDAPGRELSIPVGPLRLMAATTGDVRVVLTGSVIAFYWSPDGRTIAALQVAEPQDDTIARADGTGSVILARARTAAAAAAGFDLRLVFVDPATGAARSERAVEVGELFTLQVLPYFDQYSLSHRIWSPDAGSVALPLVDEAGTTGIVVIPADGGPPKRITDGVAAAWSP